jgi:hypothetical protein
MIQFCNDRLRLHVFIGKMANESKGLVKGHDRSADTEQFSEALKMHG